MSGVTSGSATLMFLLLQPAGPCGLFLCPTSLHMRSGDHHLRSFRTFTSTHQLISLSCQNHWVFIAHTKLPYIHGVSLRKEALAYPRSDVRGDFRFRHIDVPPFTARSSMWAFSLPATSDHENRLTRLMQYPYISQVFSRCLEPRHIDTTNPWRSTGETNGARHPLEPMTSTRWSFHIYGLGFRWT